MVSTHAGAFEKITRGFNLKLGAWSLSLSLELELGARGEKNLIRVLQFNPGSLHLERDVKKNNFFRLSHQYFIVYFY